MKKGGEWQLDPQFHAVFPLTHGSITVINPKDEDPFSLKHFQLNSQYIHGGVSQKGTSFSVGILFRVVKDVQLYCSATHKLYTECVNSSKEYSQLYKDFDKEQLLFHYKLEGFYSMNKYMFSQTYHITNVNIYFIYSKCRIR